MATLLQTVGVFGEIFQFMLPMLLVFALITGLLQKTKVLSDKLNINSVVGFTIGFIVALSGAGRFIMELTPYLASFFVIIFLIMLIFLFFGADPKWLFNSKGYSITLLIIAVIFVLFVVGQLYGSTLSNISDEQPRTYSAIEGEDGEVVISESVIPGPETCDFENITGQRAMACILGNPKVLGTVILLGLLALATFFMVYVPGD